MATVYPFKALRPKPGSAAAVASVPYDVVTADEARTLANGNPLSFLRVSRAEIELSPQTDPYSEAVYGRAAENFDKLKAKAYVVEAEPTIYLYRLRMGDHEQTGVAACYSLAEYDSGVIKKHERTRRDKEDDRTRHMLALGAQTGPVFLTYRTSGEIDTLADRIRTAAPLFDFDAPDGVRHTIWRASPADAAAVVAAFARIPALYIADGHHRAASAARARDEVRAHDPARTPGEDRDVDKLLAVAFPDDQVQVLPYNRVVSDLSGMSPDQFVAAVSKRFEVVPGQPAPAKRGEISMFVGRAWHRLTPRTPPDARDPIASLDVTVLQDGLLAPILGIEDVRTDKRIDFVGGIRGTGALEKLVDSGRAAVAFSMFPVSVDDLMNVSDSGAIMPPKSTWFEPKLRDGLLIHQI